MNVPPEFDWLIARARAARPLLNEAFRNYRPQDPDGASSLVRQPSPRGPLTGGAAVSIPREA